MGAPDQQHVTLLLREWSAGNQQALDELMQLLYDPLRKLAGRCLRAERPDHTLRATALVHEAYLQLVDSDVAWESRAHFYAVAARVLRHILVDHAKAQNRQKRGGGAEKIPLDEAVMVGPGTSREIIELDEALKRLAVHDVRKSEIVQLLFFWWADLRRDRHRSQHFPCDCASRVEDAIKRHASARPLGL